MCTCCWTRRHVTPSTVSYPCYGHRRRAGCPDRRSCARLSPGRRLKSRQMLPIGPACPTMTVCVACVRLLPRPHPRDQLCGRGGRDTAAAGERGRGPNRQGATRRSRTGTASERDQARAAETGPDAPRRRGAQRRREHRTSGGRAPLSPVCLWCGPPYLRCTVTVIRSARARVARNSDGCAVVVGPSISARMPSVIDRAPSSVRRAIWSSVSRMVCGVVAMRIPPGGVFCVCVTFNASWLGGVWVSA